MVRDNRGQSMFESLLVMPILLLLIFFIFELGLLMLNFAVVNYAASFTAVQAAKNGQFDNNVRAEVADYLKNWTVGGKDLAYNTTATAPYEDSNTVVIWGTAPGTQVQFGDDITVGVVYPVKLKIFDAVDWLVSDVQLTLKASGIASSEVYYEP